ncbi:cadherin-like protein 26 isoform X2 [Oryzias melastigma]|uniref:cadherin-like protein 26 isoform X2 n=1 Tax=Oryzias melastigma TaxID=30732 RepID=UPI00168D52DB|nr:cadherin-like protein 26 isoform X2 [Oryzias melastigma]
MSSTAVINLNIVDRNTNMPVFKEREYQTKASELEIKDDILRLAVDDKDTPNTDGWRAKYFFISGNEEGIFKLETDPITNEGILSITKKKNFEITSLVNLKIGVENIEPFSKCENGKLVKQESKLPDSVSIKVLMIDTNDPPEFRKTNIDVFEKEESDPGKILFTPEVHDPDSTSFRYLLVEDPANWVSVDEKTGEIRTTKKMDRESPFVDDDNVYKLVIAAIDDGDPPASSSCTISIHLRDTNDHKPHLVNSSLIMCGNRNNKVMVSVKDLDADPYGGPFHFSLNNTEDMKKWKLDPDYGQQGGLVSLNPLLFGNYSVSLEIGDLQNNIARETLKVVVCDCGEMDTCRSKKPLSIDLGAPAIGLIIAGFVLFLLLLLALGKFGQPKHINLKDTGNQTLIKYNEEGPLPSCNNSLLASNRKSYHMGKSVNQFSSVTDSHPKSQTDKSPKTGPDGSKMINVLVRPETSPFSFNYEMSNSRFNTMTSKNSHHQRNFSRGHDGRYMNKSLSHRFSSVRSDYHFSSYIERKLSMMRKYEADADLNAGKPDEKLFIYKYEGKMSEDASLDKLSFNDLEDDLQFLDDLGPKFKTLADIVNKTSSQNKTVSGL